MSNPGGPVPMTSAGIELPDLATWIDNTPEVSTVPGGDFLHDPNTGERLQENRASSPDQVERVLASAWSAHASRAWQLPGVEGRAELLLRLADLVDDRQQVIAVLDSLNSGVRLKETTLFASSLGGTIRAAVDLALRRGESGTLDAAHGPVVLRRVPWGPTVLIAPWNAPAAVAIKKMTYALVAGAPVVLKPSPFSPWSAQLIAAAVAEAGLPRGVFSLVLGAGDVGQQLCSDPRTRAISMTGSTATGQRIAEASARNLTRLQLELGSNNPALVLADADVASTIDSLVAGMTKLNGQWCEAPRRVFVQEGIHADLLQGLSERLGSMRVGSSMEAGTDVGPMAFRQRRDDLVAQREDLVARGSRADHADGVPGGGWFFAPSVVSAPTVPLPDEVFGPMIAVEPFTSIDTVIDQARLGPHGLAGYVFSTDVERAMELGSQLEAGEVKVNGTSVLDMAPGSAQSFFGDSGLGGHGDSDLLDFHTGKRVVGLDLPGVPI